MGCVRNSEEYQHRSSSAAQASARRSGACASHVTGPAAGRCGEGSGADMETVELSAAAFAHAHPAAVRSGESGRNLQVTARRMLLDDCCLVMPCDAAFSAALLRRTARRMFAAPWHWHQHAASCVTMMLHSKFALHSDSALRLHMQGCGAGLWQDHGGRSVWRSHGDMREALVAD